LYLLTNLSSHSFEEPACHRRDLSPCRRAFRVKAVAGLAGDNPRLVQRLNRRSAIAGNVFIVAEIRVLPEALIPCIPRNAEELQPNPAA
jgi:hypothetical protein